MVLALLAGIGGGWAFYLVWRRILPRARSRVFWQAVPVHASGMVKSQDPDDVMRHYGALMGHALRFGGRNTLAVIAGLLPVAALFLLSDALYRDERRANIVELSPANAVSGMPGSVPRRQTADGTLLIDRREIGGEKLRLRGETLDGSDLGEKRAFCSGALSCLGYELMLFETYRLPREQGGDSLVVRPRAFAANPLWPYVDDLELAFFAGVVAGGIAAGWLASRASAAPP